MRNKGRLLTAMLVQRESKYWRSWRFPLLQSVAHRTIGLERARKRGGEQRREIATTRTGVDKSANGALGTFQQGNQLGRVALGS